MTKVFLSPGATYNISEVVNDKIDLGVALNNAAEKAVHSSNHFSNNIRDFVQEIDKQRVEIQRRKRSVHDVDHYDGTSQRIFSGGTQAMQSLQLPNRMINSNSASTSAMVMLTFDTLTSTPALMVTREAISALRLISA